MNAKLKKQYELELLYSNNQLMPTMRSYFESLDFDEIFEGLEVDPKFGYSALIQLALHKRCDVSTLVGITKCHFDSAQECADALDGLIEMEIIGWDSNTWKFVTKFVLPNDLQAEIDKFQYPLPLVVEPRKLAKNTDTGYFVAGKSGSVILRDNHTEEDVCLDHLNRMNAVKYQLNIDTAVMVNNRWKHLDSCKKGETHAEYQKRVRAFHKYNTHALGVMALLVEEGNEFHLSHAYDARGRTYAQGYYVNPQGTEWNKAVVELFDEEVTI